MLTGDSDKVKELIRSKDWPGVKTQIEEDVNPRGLMKAIMSMARELFEEKAQFARPQNNYMVKEEFYLPPICVDALIEKIKQNRRRFI